MAVQRPPVTTPGFPSDTPSIADLVNSGAYVRTNRENQGAWQGYLNSIRRTPDYTAGNATFFETPADRAGGGGTRPLKPAKPLPPGAPRGRNAGAPVRGGGKAKVGTSPSAPSLGAIPAGRYDAAQETRPGTPEANYAAGLRTYGAGMRSAPNVGAVRNKAGYNERDRRVAARGNRDNLAIGDEMARVRLLGG